jgi:hypothetical protein
LSLIEQLTKEVGRLGFHNLVAEVSEVGPELPVLRRAGFAVYTRQDIWRCEQLPETGDPGILQPFQTNHEWDVQLLYANNVPRLIQLVEPHPPLENGQSWVLYEDGELVAHVHLNNGEVASWMRLLIHPNANTSTESVIHSALQLAAGSADHPVFLCIRRYQSWIQSSLQQTGFEHWGSQAVLVKHLANPMQKRDSVQLSVLDPQTVPSSSPLVQGFSRSKSAEKQAMPLREQARSFSQGELVPE